MSDLTRCRQRIGGFLLRQEMRFVHQDGSEPALPEMAGHPQPGIDPGRIAPVGVGKCLAQTVFMGGYEDQMHMVGHQAPRPDCALRPFRGREHELFVCGVVVLTEEHLLTPVAALDDVLRQSRDDNTGDAGHGRSVAGW